MKNKAIFLDLDGTLWNREVIPHSALIALKKARANGHRVFVNTGRTRDNIPQFLWDMNLDGYILATGMDLFVKGKHIRTTAMDPEKVARIEQVLINNGSGYSLVCKDRNFDDPKFAFRRDIWLKKEEREEFMNRLPLSHIQDEDRKEIVKIYFDTETPFDLASIAQKEDMDILTYKNKHNPLNGFGSFFRGELTDNVQTKAKAMKEAVNRLDPHLEIMAVGDSENDIPMLLAADYSICMGNGTENAKKAAKYVTDSIDEDGLYKAFVHFGLIEEDPADLVSR